MPDATAETPGLSRRTAMLALAGILAVGAVVRFAHIGEKDLWLDECVSAIAAKGTLARTAADVARFDAHPPGYYLALNLSTRVFGSDEAGLRALSALASVACLALVYLLGAMLFDRATGLLAAGALAVSSFQLYFAQEARLHALVTFLVLAMTVVFVRMLQARASTLRAVGPWAAAYAALAAAALYTYYYAAFAIAAHAAAFLALWLGAGLRPDDAGRRWLVTRAHAAVVAPLIFAAMVLGAEAFIVGWGPVAVGRAASAADVASAPYGLAEVGHALRQFLAGLVVDRAEPQLDALARGALAVLAVLPLAGLGCLVRRRPGAAVLLACGAFVPFLAVAWVMRPHVFEPKHLVFVAPLAFLMVAAGWTEARARPWALLALVALVVLNGAMDAAYLQPGYEKQPWRRAVRAIEAVEAPTDVIVASPPYAAHALGRYYRGKRPVIAAEGPEWSRAVIAAQPGRVWLVELRGGIAEPDPAAARWLASFARGAPFAPKTFHGYSTFASTITVRGWLCRPAAAR